MIRRLLARIFPSLRTPMEIREERILKDYGCLCWCPVCKDPLNDQAACEDTDRVSYTCSKCGCKSEWNFELAPVPILMKARDY